MIITPEKLKKARELNYIRARESLAHYFKWAWKIMEPGTPLIWNWHYDYLAEHLEAVKMRQIKRLIINVPPRSAKSNLATVAFPTWVWAEDPYRKFMTTSYSASLSTFHSVKRRELIESEWYQAGYGRLVKLKDDENRKDEFTNTKSGTMISAGLTGSTTGKGCNILIIDDPTNPKEAYSKVELAEANRLFDTTLLSRLNDKRNDAIILNMQRLVPGDMTDHVLASGDWVHIVLPAEEQNHRRLISPITKRQYIRKPGDLLQPTREPKDVLDAIKRNSSRDYQAQYLQQPVSLEGELVKREWWKRYKVLPARFDEMVMAWDLAMTVKQTSDFTVGTVWGRSGQDLYLVDRVRGRWEFPDVCRQIIALCRKYPKVGAKLIEAKASGPAAIQTLKKQVPGILEADTGGRDKRARVMSITYLIEGGYVYVPDESICPWVEEFLDEWSAFDGTERTKDDQVDSSFYGIDRLRQRSVIFEPLSGHSHG